MSARAKFSLMMFLEFFVWGAWFPLAFDYLTRLNFDSGEKSWFMNMFALASLTAMFFSTQFADRHFAAERFLAFSHAIGGLAILGIGLVAIGWVNNHPLVDPLRNALGPKGLFWSFLILMLIHALFYVPTISITNSIAFANLPDPQNDFGKVRLWGTIGWIAASWPFVFILVDWARIPVFGSVEFVDWLGEVFKVENNKQGVAYLNGVSLTYVAAGIASLLLAAFSLALPHTPPKPARTGEEHFAWLEAMKLLAKPFVFVLFIVTFIDAAVHQGFFLLTGSFLIDKVKIAPQWVMPVMSIGQIAEVATMALLGFVLKSLGWRMTMILGILGHTARFGIFAFFPEPAPAILVNVLHGICYAFFFATVYIFVDEYFPKDARASAQGLFNFLILGFGPFIGNFVWPYFQDNFKTDNIVDYQKLFLIPSGTALAAAVLLLLFFHPPKVKVPAPAIAEEEGAVAPAP
jgi:hypothetical protein